MTRRNPPGAAGQRRLREIEADWGAPLDEILRLFAESGWRKKATAAALGLSKQTVDRRSHLPWRRDRTAEPGTVEKIRRRRLERDVIWVERGGERMSLAEACRRERLPEEAIRDRYRRGLRGDELFAPLRWSWRKPESYRLGITVAEAEEVADYAREHGIKTAAQRLHLPYGAVSALVSGDDWRVA